VVVGDDLGQKCRCLRQRGTSLEMGVFSGSGRGKEGLTSCRGLFVRSHGNGMDVGGLQGAVKVQRACIL